MKEEDNRKRKVSFQHTEVHVIKIGIIVAGLRLVRSQEFDEAVLSRNSSVNQ